MDVENTTYYKLSVANRIKNPVSSTAIKNALTMLPKAALKHVTVDDKGIVIFKSKCNNGVVYTTHKIHPRHIKLLYDFLGKWTDDFKTIFTL